MAFQPTQINWDFFFYADTLDIKEEIEADLILGLVQPVKSLYFNREDGTLIPKKENIPVNLKQAISLRFDIARFIAKRNTEVSDGADNGRDYRVAASQSTIEFKKPRVGELEINVGYFRLIDTEFSKAQVTV